MLTRRPFLTAATAIFVIGLAGPTPGLAANEKGPRCSDGIDNDGDGLIDCISEIEDLTASAGVTTEVEASSPPRPRLRSVTMSPAVIPPSPSTTRS